MVEWKHRCKTLEGRVVNLKAANDALRRKIDDGRLAAQFLSDEVASGAVAMHFNAPVDEAPQTAHPSSKPPSPPPPPPPALAPQTSLLRHRPNHTPKVSPSQGRVCQNGSSRKMTSTSRKQRTAEISKAVISIPKRSNSAATFFKQRKEKGASSYSSRAKSLSASKAPMKTRYEDMLRRARKR